MNCLTDKAERDTKWQMLVDKSRSTGERSIETALAEIELITENVYVQRQKRTLETDAIPMCSCIDDKDQPTACGDDCINRAALIECNPIYCPCRKKCGNQRIQKGKMPKTEIRLCGQKGLGLFAMQDIEPRAFVGEYVGEIVTQEEYYARQLKYHNEKHRYIMVLSGGEVIDATRKGGLARFINHSCEPNCSVEKWEVDGEERCGIFARQGIRIGDELSFDYKFQSFNSLEIKECLCNSTRCRRIIGANNRSSASTQAPTQIEKPKSFDPIIREGHRIPKGRKAADSFDLRMRKSLLTGRVLGSKDVALVRDSGVFLHRNLTVQLDNEFSYSVLEPYFYLEEENRGPGLKLHNVPDIIRLEEIEDHPIHRRQPQESFTKKKERLNDLITTKLKKKKEH